MKLIVLLLIVAGFVFTTSCESENKEGSSNPEKTEENTNDQVEGDIQISYTDAVVYGKFFVEHQTKLLKLILDMGNVAENSSTEELNAYVDEMIALCEETIGIFKNVEGFNGSTELRDAAIELYGFYSRMMKDQYKQMVDIITKEESEITNEDMAMITEIEKSIGEEEIIYDNLFQTAQQNFSKTNNLILFENEMQKDIDDLGNWSESDKSEFLNACLEGFDASSEIDGESYCNCMLEKIMKKYPKSFEAVNNMTDKEITEMALDCVK